MDQARPGRRTALLAALGLGLAISLLALEARRTAPVRGSIRTLAALVGAANRGDLAAAGALCTPALLRRNPPTPAPEGGLQGLPRSIDRSFRAWREGDAVLVCPTGRSGFVFRFLPDKGIWKFDGPSGLLDRRGNFLPHLPEE
jgi:hypothetical protein